MNKNCLNQEKIKAIIEAMIFVSPEPVSARQVLTKIKQVLKKDLESLLLPEEEWSLLAEESVSEVDLESDSDADNEEAEVEAALPDESANMDTKLQAETETSEESEESVSENEGESTQEEVTEGADADEIDFGLTHRDIKTWLKEIAETFSQNSHGFELVHVAKAYQFRTKYDVTLHLRAEKKALPNRLSASAMETLAIVAYEQPAARSKVDDVRGVDSGGVLRTLLEKEFIRIIGRADEPGQPLLYGTTPKFLEVFNLKSLKDLPSLNEIKELHVAEDDEDDQVSYYDSEEMIEQRMNELSEEEEELMNELDESLQQVKSTEQEIEMFQDKKTKETTSETTPEVSN